MSLFGKQQKDKEKFIKQLESFKERIKTEDPKIWIDSLSGYLKKIFPLSFADKVKQIEGISFYNLDFTKERGTTHWFSNEKPQSRATAQHYIDNFIKEINDNGLEKINSNSSFVKYRFETIIGFVITLIGGAFFLGEKIGSTKYEKDKIELHEKNKKLEEDISKKDKQIEQHKKEIEIYKKQLNK